MGDQFWYLTPNVDKQPLPGALKIGKKHSVDRCVRRSSGGASITCCLMNLPHCCTTSMSFRIGSLEIIRATRIGGSSCHMPGSSGLRQHIVSIMHASRLPSFPHLLILDGSRALGLLYNACTAPKFSLEGACGGHREFRTGWNLHHRRLDSVVLVAATIFLDEKKTMCHRNNPCDCNGETLARSLAPSGVVLFSFLN